MAKKYIICDLDGTLCDHKHRVHYAWLQQWVHYNSRCRYDQVNIDVRNFLEEAESKDFKIIFLTGRSEEYRNMTIEWLNSNISLKNYDLLMRKNEDFTRSDKMKRAILEKFFEGRDISQEVYKAIDDDEACCRMFHAMGVVYVHYK